MWTIHIWRSTTNSRTVNQGTFTLQAYVVVQVYIAKLVTIKGVSTRMLCAMCCAQPALLFKNWAGAYNHALTLIGITITCNWNQARLSPALLRGWLRTNAGCKVILPNLLQCSTDTNPFLCVFDHCVCPKCPSCISSLRCIPLISGLQGSSFDHTKATPKEALPVLPGSISNISRPMLQTVIKLSRMDGPIADWWWGSRSFHADTSKLHLPTFSQT